MNSRLIQFLAAENVTQSQFADSINVARASISHIVAGRNKPGYDFITAVMRRYPDLNIEWLLCGKGKMYKEKQGISSSETSSKSDSLERSPSNSGSTMSGSGDGRWDSPDSDLLFDPEEFVRNFQHRPSPQRSAGSPAPKTSVSDTDGTGQCAALSNFETSRSINTSIGKTQHIEFQRKATKITVFFNDGTYQEFGAM